MDFSDACLNMFVGNSNLLGPISQLLTGFIANTYYLVTALEN
jgi:hypothetical protein